MSKVGILTIIDQGNFGNRLQNFALQEVIRRLGHEPITIKNSAAVNYQLGPVGRTARFLMMHGLRAALSKAYRGLRPVSVSPGVKRIEAGNSHFTRGLIRESDVSLESLSDPSEFAGGFRYFVVGSDQVWNPHYRHLNSADFLTFAQEGQRIAYAASFGVSHLTPFVERRYSALLAGIPELSVREYEAAQIVEKLTGRSVPVVLDPTMLVDTDVWHSLATVPVGLEEPDYVAQFHFGGPDESKTVAISEYAKKHGLRIVDLGDVGSDHFCDSPSDLLGALRGAHLVVTDSFHVAALSTVFHRPYLVQRRGAMNSRFRTLARKTGIRALDWQTLSDIDSVMNVDWSTVDAAIDSEREESGRFLANALGVAQS